MPSEAYLSLFTACAGTLGVFMACAGTLGGISVAIYGVRRHLGRHIYRYLRCAGAPWEAYMLQFMVCAGALGGISVAIYGVCGRLGGISIVFYGVRGAFPATFVAICGFCAPEGMPPLDRGTAPVPNWGEKIMCASCADHVRKHFWPLVDFGNSFPWGHPHMIRT